MLVRHHKRKGYSLIELMVTLTLSLLLLTGLLSYLTKAIKTSADTYQNSKISQELNAVMELMVRDIRRAGYSGTALNAATPAEAEANAFTQSAIPGANDGGINLETNGCILYSYDMPGTENGLKDSGERLGFKLDGGIIYTASGPSGASCSAAGWQPITDPDVTEITELSFDYLNANDSIANPQSPIISATGPGWFLCTRNIRVTLAGRLTKDPTVAIRTYSQDIRVRNDWYKMGGTTC